VSANRHYDFFEERWGFRYGAANVTRVSHVEGRYHVIGIDTPHRHVQVGVSPTGRSVRVWVDGEELARAVPSVQPGEDGP
jgi:hypothetical protein